MNRRTAGIENTDPGKTAQQHLDQLLRDQTSWIAEVGRSLERSDAHLKQRMQFFDRLAVLSGAILAFSVPAFTSLRNPNRFITHRYTGLGCAVAGWALLFIATIGSAVTHYLLVDLFAVWSSEHESNVQSALFNNLNLLQKRLMRSAGGSLEELQVIPMPAQSFRRRSWHGGLPRLLSITTWATLLSCFLGAAGIFLFLIFSSF